MMWIIGYGSLMNKNEFKNKKYRLVKIKGWKRIFDVDVTSGEKWVSEMDGNKRAVLTLIPSPDSTFNAIAYFVSSEELERLIKREEIHDLKKMQTLDYSTGEKFEECSAFVVRKYEKKKGLLPVEKYLDLCREGAYSWGEDFGREFDRTTFLCDGITSIEKYIT